ncbi:hypothetical protein TWF730_008779 [Orbilia blumenaviensis]|uniref:Uncharacterized protein n=1 Tax=Orbilia blumenaviensis TaxID=1796055 RepID=A0AAV9V3C2_9PEZI
MKFRAVVQCLAVGLSVFPITFVNAFQGYMTIENFEAWVHDNEEAFLIVGEDLRWLIYLANIDRPLSNNPGPDAEVTRSLSRTLQDVTNVFENLQARVNEGGLTTPPERDGSPDMFFERELMNLKSMMDDFKINLRRNVWENRVVDELIEQITPIDATRELVQRLEHNGLDLTDPIAVAMWALDAQDVTDQQISDTVVISYNTNSLKRLRAAFKSVHDGYKAIAEVINRVYTAAIDRYPNPLDRDLVFAIETPLRRFQNLIFSYQGVFSDKISGKKSA